jgi:hypothetical protein
MTGEIKIHVQNYMKIYEYMTWNDDIDTTNIPTTMNEFIYVKNQIA